MGGYNDLDSDASRTEVGSNSERTYTHIKETAAALEPTAVSLMRLINIPFSSMI